MRKLITGAFISLDDVMQAPGGPEEDPSGGFALEQPTEAEMARREKMKREG